MDFLLLVQSLLPLFSLLMVYSFYNKWFITTKDKSDIAPEAAGAWPIIGHLHLLGGPEPVFEKLGAMADKYGPVFTIRVGLRRTLVISSWEAAKECFTVNDKAFSSRPDSAASHYMGYGRAMLGLAPYGPYWRELRKITTLHLLSSSRLEALRQVRSSEIDYRVKELYRLSVSEDGTGRKPVKIDLKKWCGDLTMNVVTRIVVGKRVIECGGDDSAEEEGRRFREAISRFFYLLGVFVVSDVIPFLKWLDIGGYKKAMKKTAEEMDCLVAGWLAEKRRRRAAAGGGGPPEDFMDVMLSIIDDAEVAGHDRDTVIKSTCLAMILGGTDTTSDTLAGCLYYMLTNPNVLERVQEELDTHVGRDRKVEESDIKNLIYLQAIVKETLRFTPAAPISVPREAMEDCSVAGYQVPAGTQLFVNLWKLQSDPSVWPDPSKFKPERFLTSHAHVEPKGHHFEYIPFGSGRRSCPGISFSLQVIHLALARLVHSFDMEMADGQPNVVKRLGLSSPLVAQSEILLNPRLASQLYD